MPTVHRRSKIAKQFFAAAIKKRIITENPFADVATANRTSNDRMVFIGRDEMQQVIEACPNVQWRLIFAFARYGGLRIPSELFGLTWNNVNWSKSRFIVRSPKTEHIEGRETRIVPIFPELLPLLREAFELAPDGENRIITIYDENNSNLRTQANRIIEKAGLNPWPKVFQNLRATRETELVESYPIQVVTAWLGNTPEVAMKHYLQVTEEHYKKAAQNAAQNMRELACSGSNEKTGERIKKAVSQENCETLRKVAKSCNSNNLQLMGPQGLEPWTVRL